MHDTFITRKRWRDVQEHEDREICTTYNMTDNISHILTQCREQMTQLIWTLTKGLWPHQSPPWPEINLGTILGCSHITMMTDNEQWDEQREQKMAHQGPTRLLLLWSWAPIFHFLAHLFHSQDIPCHLTPYLSPAIKSRHPKEYHISSWTATSPFKPIGCWPFIVLHHRLQTPQAILSHSIVLHHQQPFRKVPSTHCPLQ